jgi:hypothetical protein
MLPPTTESKNYSADTCNGIDLFIALLDGWSLRFMQSDVSRQIADETSSAKRVLLFFGGAIEISGCPWINIIPAKAKPGRDGS